MSALDFDGDDVAYASDNAGFNVTTAITIECWVYNDVAAQAFKGIVYKSDQYALLTETSGYPRFYLWNATDGDLTLDGTATIPTTGWIHIAAVRNGNNAALFVDGTRVASSTTAGTNSSDDGTSDFCVGAQTNTGTAGFDGRITEVRISNSQRYDPTASTLTVPTSAFTSDGNTLALYHFDEGSGTTVDNAEGTAALDLTLAAATNDPAWDATSPFAGGSNLLLFRRARGF